MLNSSTIPNLYTIYEFTDDALKSAVIKNINCRSEKPKSSFIVSKGRELAVG